jgi:hypothetical protein
MKTISTIRSIVSLLMFFLIIQPCYPQYFTQRNVTRGADTAEIYIGLPWYFNGHTTINGIFRSRDNGASLSVQRGTLEPVGNVPIFGDSVPGGLFMIPYNALDSFGISFDYGKTFQKRHSPDIYGETAGCMAGECYISGFGLYRGTNYGNNFTLQSNNIALRLEDVGTLPGEVYCIVDTGYSNPVKLAYSSDYGQTFSIRNVPIPGMGVWFAECDIHRGTQPGEIYFAIWESIDSVALFHSFDYGQTLSFQGYMLDTYEELYATAGRTPGTFYYVRWASSEDNYALLWIYFSRDYGVTFTTYYYDLDSVFTGLPQKEILSQLKIFPNPASDRVTFRLGDKLPDYDSKITLYDLIGKPVLEGILPKGQLEVTLSTKKLPAGIYCYSITSDKISLLSAKNSMKSQESFHGKIIINR